LGSQTEIENLSVTSLGDNEICLFDVAVHDAFSVRGIERIDDFNCQG
jgi:hypothetical protein